MLTDPRVSACIVLYHSPMSVLDTVRCLEEADEAVTLFVMDNSPLEDMAERIAFEHPGARILPQAKNQGFGRANTVVLPMLKSRYHLLINPDGTFDPAQLSAMVAYMDAHPDAAASSRCPAVSPRCGISSWAGWRSWAAPSVGHAANTPWPTSRWTPPRASASPRGASCWCARRSSAS